ncbi:hypothetical protein MNEG_14783, partial [Monoraphidium neglectum]
RAHASARAPAVCHPAAAAGGPGGAARLRGPHDSLSQGSTRQAASPPLHRAR